MFTTDITSAKNLTSMQRVAALLIVLGPEMASEILKYFEDEAEVERLALEVASMQRLSQDVFSEILQEFYAYFEASGYITQGGVSVARQILQSAFGEDKAEEMLQKLVSTLQKNPFDFFNQADPLQLATSFQNENPQMIALVLAYLRPDKAANIISSLPPEIQVEVSKRIATMDTTNPEVLREIELILENKFSSVVSTDFTQVGGIEWLAEILNLSDRASEKWIIEQIDVKDPDMANAIREMMFVFEDIVKMDDRSIQRILREVETKDLALALKGSNNEVKEKIFKNMSERAANMLKEDMEYMGPVKSRDVSDKQSQIVGIIRALEAAGEIVLATSGKDQDEFIE